VLSGHPEWCGAPEAETKSCDPLLSAALDTALAGLRRTLGDDIANWRWGRAHIAVFANPVFARLPLLRDWLLRDWAEARIPSSGGFDTVNRGSTTIRDGAHPYEQRFGAGLRIITDLASPADSRMIAVPGQSGNPLSPHFSDLLRRWRDFDYLVPGRAATVHTLRLEPAE